jgi:hypothetical protein
VDVRLAAIRDEGEQIPEAHRIPVGEAEAQERAAREADQAAVAAQAQATVARDSLLARRTAAARYRDEIGQAAEEAGTFGELADLLKEGGLVQTEVAEQEQRRIAGEVNAVLDLLEDPLRVSLGDARRRRQGGTLQDLHIVDTSDPSGHTRSSSFPAASSSASPWRWRWRYTGGSGWDRPAP